MKFAILKRLPVGLGSEIVHVYEGITVPVDGISGKALPVFV